MLAVFSFCHKDSDLALKQAQWVRSLGGVKDHNALVVCNAEARKRKLHESIVDTLSSAFNYVDSFSPKDEVEDGWPQSPNHIWVRTVQHVRDYKEDVPFLWIEADAVPTCETWMTQISNQFLACRKNFMGAWVQMKDILPHMSGNAVYYRTWEAVPPFACVDKTAWDVALALLIEPHFHRTKLIQHEWKPNPFNTVDDLKRIQPEAVIYHQCKDGSLIDRLIESQGGVVAARPVHLGEVAGSTPAPTTSEDAENLKEALRQIEELKAIIKSNGKPMKKGRSPMSTEERMAASERAREMWKKRKMAMK